MTISGKQIPPLAGTPPATLSDAASKLWVAQVAQAVYLNATRGSGVTLLTIIDLPPVVAPPNPPPGHYYLFCDAADSKLKAIGPSGTITDIANP